MMPCRQWSPENKQCYICSSNCAKFNDIHDPAPRDLLDTLTCDRDCDKMVVTSYGSAAVWQNKRTGLFSFIGEHNGRPTYQNNATKEYLYYTFTGAEWLVGPDFRKPHAGMMMQDVLLGVAEIQELGPNKSYMVDTMDIITSEKEFFHNMEGKFKN